MSAGRSRGPGRSASGGLRAAWRLTIATSAAWYSARATGLFALSVPRLMLAYRTGAMRYGVFTFGRGKGSE